MEFEELEDPVEVCSLQAEPSLDGCWRFAWLGQDKAFDDSKEV